MLKGFKEFISQGNVIDLAVAVIIGNAFKPIVDKVTETIMGIIGQVIGSPELRLRGQVLAPEQPAGRRRLHLPRRDPHSGHQLPAHRRGGLLLKRPAHEQVQ